MYSTVSPFACAYMCGWTQIFHFIAFSYGRCPCDQERKGTKQTKIHVILIVVDTFTRSFADKILLSISWSSCAALIHFHSNAIRRSDGNSNLNLYHFTTSNLVALFSRLLPLVRVAGFVRLWSVDLVNFDFFICSTYHLERVWAGRIRWAYLLWLGSNEHRSNCSSNPLMLETLSTFSFDLFFNVCINQAFNSAHTHTHTRIHTYSKLINEH